MIKFWKINELGQIKKDILHRFKKLSYNFDGFSVYSQCFRYFISETKKSISVHK